MKVSMIGQGSPTSTPWSSPSRARHHIGRFLPAMLVALFLCALGTFVSPTSAQEKNLRLRIAWGGGTARQWQGSVSISEGSLSEIVPLGLEADEPGSMVLQDRTVEIQQPSVRTYDGLDLKVTAPLTAKLTVQLSPRDAMDRGGELEISLSDLVHQSGKTSLDEHGNRLLVLRSPGDRLRIRFDRDSMVFSPGETFHLEPAPHLAGLAADTSFKCKVQVHRSSTGKEVLDLDRSVRSDADGALPKVGAFSIPIPMSEGVYDILVTFTPKRFGVPLVPVKPILERKIQFVVVAEKAPPADRTTWKEEVDIDPAHPGWWERVKRAPQLKLIPGFGRGPLGNSKAQTVKHGRTDLIEMAPEGWQAYPLPIDEVGMPHILEVEYPTNRGQTLGISIVEPNADGMVTPLGLDSAVDVPEPVGEAPMEMQRHRLIFWPRTKTPLVLLTNQRGDAKATFGKLRVLAGPETLPPLQTEQNEGDERLLAAYFDKPLFASNFGSKEAFDPITGRTLDDWSKFYFGALRMIEYLKHVGYNGAVISVARDGSAIYPSQILQPTPRFDNGTFFISGQDPLRKDVLEMLMRLFDREGMTLITAVDFSSPIPRLEKLRREETETTGIELLDGQGRSRLQQSGFERYQVPYYNPLDERVQDAAVAVMEELAERYGHHRSFGGAALQMGGHTYAQLPGLLWGCDDQTIRRFAREQDVEVPGEGLRKYRERAGFLRTAGREKWLAWRSTKLAEMYQRMQQTLASRRQGAKLYLATADMFQGREVQKVLRPLLPRQTDVAGAMLQMGIDLKRYEKKSEIVLLRPQRFALQASLMAQAVDSQVSNSSQFDEQFSAFAAPGSIFFHEARIRPLPSFDVVSPFGKEKTQVQLVTHASPSGAFNRRRFVHSLATHDAQSLLDGGWMLPLGQEDSLRGLFEVYRRLPDRRFETVGRRASDSPAQPVTVRKLTVGDQTYLYLVNDSPWPLTVELQISAAPSCRMVSLGSRRLLPFRGTGHPATWRVELLPYDLVGGVLTSSEVKIEDWKVDLPVGMLAKLRHGMDQIRARANALRDPQPTVVLQNASFELPRERGDLPGWISTNDPTTRVDIVDGKKYEGTRALKLASDKGVAWMRSDPFQPPKTGRVSISVWLCVEDDKKQPPLRLAIEGKRADSSKYYRFATVGTGRGAPPLKAQWSEYVFHIDDLPVQELTELRVGFDLMGPGEVWIDKVRVYDLWFQNNERNELLKNIALADIHHNEGKVSDCERFLAGYWSRFLMENVELRSRVASNPRRERFSEVPKNRVSPPPSKPPKKSLFKDWLPKKVWPFN